MNAVIKCIPEVVRQEYIIEEIVKGCEGYKVVGIEAPNMHALPLSIFELWNINDEELLQHKFQEAINNVDTPYKYKLAALNASQTNKVTYNIYRVVKLGPENISLNYQYQYSGSANKCYMLLTNDFFGIILSKQHSTPIDQPFQFQSTRLDNFFNEPSSSSQIFSPTPLGESADVLIPDKVNIKEIPSPLDCPQIEENNSPRASLSKEHIPPPKSEAQEIQNNDEIDKDHSDSSDDDIEINYNYLTNDKILKVTKLCAICGLEHEVLNNQVQFIDLHCNTLATPHLASRICLEASFLSNYSKYKSYRDVICNECNSFVHPNIKNHIRRIKYKMEQLLSKSGSIKIGQFAKYPIPIDLGEKSKNPQLYEQCVYDGFYFEKNQLILICKNGHFAQLCKMEETVKTNPNPTCPKCKAFIEKDAVAKVPKWDDPKMAV
jgi:hypothetical protein